MPTKQDTEGQACNKGKQMLKEQDDTKSVKSIPKFEAKGATSMMQEEKTSCCTPQQMEQARKARNLHHNATMLVLWVHANSRLLFGAAAM